jgi:FAD/FMN-containing dehydrogenase
MGVNASSIDRLRGAVSGRILVPGDVDYDDSRRVFNGRIDRRPAVVLQCKGADDVSVGLAFAREAGLEVAVRGGGHSIAGFSVCDDGLVIDLSPMKQIDVSPRENRARVAAGARWGDLDTATQAHGLAVPGGVVSTTGVAGLTLGGGFGYLSRKYGLSCDNLVGADVVTASGKVLRASEQENPDLFWALRGGGGNFGVVTSFEFGLHPVSGTVVGIYAYPLERGVDVLRHYYEFTKDQPDDLSSGFVIWNIYPDHPIFPPELYGMKLAVILAAHVGPVDEAKEVLAPLGALGGAAFQMTVRMPYRILQRAQDGDIPWGTRVYWKSAYFDAVTDRVAETIMTHAAAAKSPLAGLALYTHGGAIARVGEDETAYPHRDAKFMCVISSACSDPTDDDTHVSWARGLYDALEPMASPGAYLNLSGDEGASGVRQSYGDAKYQRLAELKALYDPDNVFPA